MENILQAARAFALNEIEKYGLPAFVHLEIWEQKALELAEKLGADSTIVQLGAYLMDIKLGQAFAEKRVADHVQMSSEAAKTFLQQFDLNDIYILIKFWIAWKLIIEKFRILALKRRFARMRIVTVLSVLKGFFSTLRFWGRGTVISLLAWMTRKRSLMRSTLSFP